MIEDFFSPKGKVQQRRLFWITFGIMLFAWAAIGIPYTNWVSSNDFIKFNNASILGKISALKPTKTGVVLSVAENDFLFYPIADQHLNNYTSFVELAAVNDSVAKKPHADTLFLFTRTGLYKYTFSKY